MTGDEKVDFHINFHRRPAAVIGGLFANFMYRMSLEEGEPVDLDVLESVEQLSMYSLIIFQNVDSIIDDLGMATGKKISLVDEYLTIMKTGGELSDRDYGYDPGKLEELAVISRAINSIANSFPDPDLYLDNFAQLAGAVKEQALERPLQERSYSSNLVEATAEEVLEFISDQGFSQEDTLNLQLSARIGAHTLGTGGTSVYGFRELSDPSFLRAIYYWGASAQLTDDRFDAKKDTIEGQYTYMTQNPSIKHGAKELEATLLSECYALLKPHQQVYMRFLNMAANSFLYMNSNLLKHVLYKDRDHVFEPGVISVER